MSHESNAAVLDKLFDPVSQCLTPEVARRIAALRAAQDVQVVLDDLAEKCNEGTLTPDERDMNDEDRQQIRAASTAPPLE